jgi:twitching motility protein PilT
VALVDSLLSAIVRADGDALVMHVGERPYVVVGTQTINISTHGLNLEAMTGMLAQLLPADAQTQLEEFGAVEHRLTPPGEDRFTVVAARGGDDIWIEIRRRRAPAAAAAPGPVAAGAPVTEPEPLVEVPPAVSEREPEPVAPIEMAEPAAATNETPEPEPLVINAQLEAVVVAAPETEVIVAILSESEPVPDSIPQPQSESVAQSEPPPVEPEPEPQPETLAAAVSVMQVLEEVEPAPELEAIEWPTAEQTVPQSPAITDIPERAAEIKPPTIEKVPEPSVQIAEVPEPIVEPITEAVAEIPEPIVESIPEPMLVEEIPEPVLLGEIPTPELVDEIAAPVMETIAESSAAPVAEPSVEPLVERQPIAASIEREAAPVSAPALAAPMTRTVRIEVPPRVAAASSRSSSDIERLLRVAAARGASALFLTSDSRPWIRMEGDLRQLDSEAAFSRADVERAAMEIAPESGLESIGKGEATEWIAEFEDVGRIRCTTFTDHRGPGLLLRMIATRAATAEQLGLSREVQALATEPQGVVLVAGPRGSGKSTLLSALVDVVNRQRQVRLVHDNRSALVSQREIRGGADETVAAARSALREGPDVLVVDDLVSPQMVPLLLTAASEGLLIFVSITAPSTADAVQRFIELAPPETRKAVQNAMAESFRGAVAQVLLKKAGGGLVAAREVLLATAPVTHVIGEGQLDQLPLALETGRKHGMVSFTDALGDNVRSGVVDVREAFRKAPDRTRLIEHLKHDGVDTTVVERLA